MKYVKLTRRFTTVLPALGLHLTNLFSNTHGKSLVAFSISMYGEFTRPLAHVLLTMNAGSWVFFLGTAGC